MVELPTGTVTFLFTDLEGSTRLWDAHSDAMRVALARHDEILRDAIAANGGHVVKGTGDGVLAAFATGHDALAAAWAGQTAMTAEAWDESTGPLRVRMGVHTGEAERREGDYFGPALNRAARLMGLAHGGQVLVSNATGALVTEGLPDGMQLIDLGEHRLRDLTRPERVFQLVGGDVRERFPRLRSLETFPGNLPVQLTSFVGREDDVARVGEAMDDSRLVTLTGVGGVGKTRLALQTAAELLPQFADGVWLCELAATNDPDLLAQVVVAALGAQSRAGLTLLESVCDYLSGKQALIVLDNCEHVLDAAADIAEAVLRSAPGVKVLATSREALTLSGEQVLPVRPLRVASEPSLEEIASSEAARLFGERASAARPSFAVDESTAMAVAEICRRLDGIPLAVELAAARVSSMSPGEIAGLLDERFRLLTGGRRRGVERHQTLRATVEWSYSLLDDRERVTFDRLGVFAGSFDADAAAAVVGDDELAAWDVRDALDDLAAKSMIVLEDGPDGTTRFGLLETLRQYALERLDEAGDAEEHRRLHAQYYARFAEVARPGLEGPDEAVWVARLDAELDNLRAAVAWALDAGLGPDAETGLRIIAELASQQLHRPSMGVGEWAEAALERAETSTPGRRTAVLTAAAYKAYIQSNLDLTRTRVHAALRDGLPADTPSPVWGYGVLAVVEAFVGHYETALQTLEAGRRAFVAIGADEYAHAAFTGIGAFVHVLGGHPEEARASAEDAVRRARALGNPTVLSLMLFYLATTRRPDESDETVEVLEECLAYGRAVQATDSIIVLRAFGLLAKLRARRGEQGPAIDALREAVVRARGTGQSIGVASALNFGVSVAADLGAYEFAATLGGAADGPLAGLTHVSPGELADRKAALDLARERLGSARYDTAIAAGSAMSYGEIIAHTLTELDRLLADVPELNV